MKILQINCVYEYGSTGRLCAQISDYLTSKSIDNYVAHGIPSVKRQNSYVINNFFDAHIHSFLSRNLCLQGLCSSIPTIRLVCFIKRYKPDIIHIHNIHGHYLNYRILFKFLNKGHYKVVWTFHDCWPMTGKCVHFTKSKCEKWASDFGCSNCCQLSAYPESKIDRSKRNFRLKKTLFTGLNDLHIVTVSEWLKSICNRSFFSGFDIRCIHNGIDTSIFSPQKNSFFSDDIIGKKVVLFVSNIWNGAKGEGIISQLDENLSDDYVLVIVGKGSEKICNNSKRVISIPQTKDQTELASIYSSADVFVCTSIEESASLVVLESMACGTPVICFDSTGVPENIKDNCGVIIPVDSISKVLDAVVSIVNHKEDYYESCINNIRQEYTIEHMCELYFALYQEIMEEK